MVAGYFYELQTIEMIGCAFIPSITRIFLFWFQKCHKCGEVFQDSDSKHHCRACGQGFCDACSSKSRPVPERGWGLGPVRVCDACFQNRGIPEGSYVKFIKTMLG